MNLLYNLLINIVLIYKLEKIFKIPIRITVSGSKGALLYDIRKKKPKRIQIKYTTLFCNYTAFMVLIHEIGHVRHPEGLSINEIEAEFNAWIWAIEYIIVNNIQVTVGMYSTMVAAFSTYLPDNVGGKEAIDLLNLLTKCIFERKLHVRRYKDI